MPTYDYKCSQCGIIREIRQRISEAPLTACPECGGPFKRIIRSVGVIFKGSGFHINDYKSSGSATPSESKSESTSEKKPETGDSPKTSDTTSAGSSGSSDTAKRENVA